jgi:hypothetical protein
MHRPDRYDIIGLGVLTLVVALWVAHFVVPAPPLEPDPNAPALTAPGGIGGPGIGGPSIGR